MICFCIFEDAGAFVLTTVFQLGEFCFLSTCQVDFILGQLPKDWIGWSWRYVLDAHHHPKAEKIYCHVFVFSVFALFNMVFLILGIVQMYIRFSL